MCVLKCKWNFLKSIFHFSAVHCTLNIIDFCILILYRETLIKSVVNYTHSSSTFKWYYLGEKILLVVLYYFSIFLSFLALLQLGPPGLWLNRNGESWYPCLLSSLRGKYFIFHHHIILAVKFLSIFSSGLGSFLLFLFDWEFLLWINVEFC